MSRLVLKLINMEFELEKQQFCPLEISKEFKNLFCHCEINLHFELDTFSMQDWRRKRSFIENKMFHQNKMKNFF